jgi:hypothetical protein
VADKLQNFTINLVQSQCTDEINQWPHPFGDMTVKHVQLQGIERDGGLTNLYENKVTLGTYSSNSFFQTDDGHLIQSAITDGTNTVSLDGNVLDIVSSYGIKRTAVAGKPNDTQLSWNNTSYITATLINNTILVQEFAKVTNVLLNSRTITFSNLPTNLPQIATSLSLTRWQNFQWHTAPYFEFWLRIGQQALLLQESNTSVSLVSYLSSTNAINPQGTTGFNVLASIVYTPPAPFTTPWFIVVGTGGRMASYDGFNWRNYDGSGTGNGPYTNGGLVDSDNITSIAIYSNPGGPWNNSIVVGGSAGKVGSIDGTLAYHAYNSGTGISNNATVIGANSINAINQINTWLVFSGGSSGFAYVGSFDGGNWYNWNATGEATTLLAYSEGPNSNVINCAANFNNGTAHIAFGSNGGYVTSVAQGTGLSTQQTYTVGSRLVVYSMDTDAHGNILALDSGSGKMYISTNYGLTYTTTTSPPYQNGYIKYIASSSPFWLHWELGNNVYYISTNNGSSWGSGFTFTGWNTSDLVYTIAYDGATTLMACGYNATTTHWQYSTGTISGTSITWSSPSPINTWIANSNPSVASLGTGEFIFAAPSAIGPNWYVAYAIYQSGAWGAISYTGASGSAGTYEAGESVAYYNGTIVIFGGATSIIVSYSSNGGSSWNNIVGISGASQAGRPVYLNGTWIAHATAPSEASTGYIYSTNNAASWTYTSVYGGNAGQGPANWAVDAYHVFGFIPEYTAANSLFVTFPIAYAWTQDYAGGTTLSNDATAISTTNVTAMCQYGTGSGASLVIGGSTGYVASWTSGVWTNYNAGTGLCNAGTVIGTNQINAFAVNGSVLAIGGANGELGSWNGIAFKNYDGTVTGTGPTSYANGSQQQLVSNLTIYTANYYNPGTGAVLMVGTQNGAINSINAATNAISPLYVNGSVLQSNIFQGFTDLNYLYAYKYENGYYLLNIAGNVENTSYVLNPTTNVLYSGVIQYAIPEIVNGKTRHLCTASGNGNPSAIVPLFDATTSYAQGYTGYTDFTNFYTSGGVGELYPSTGITTATFHIQPLLNGASQTVGNFAAASFGYAEFLYYQTSTSTNIYNFYSPQFVPTPVNAYSTNQCNTPTSVNAYGKLTNNYGALTSQPFEFRVVMINNSAYYLSVAPVGGGYDNLGVMITNVGEFDNAYTPQTVNDSCVLYRYNGSFFIVDVVESPPNLIQKVGEQLYKINTISPFNLVDTAHETLQIGSCDFNGRVIFTSTVAGTAGQFFDALFEGPFSQSVDPGERQISIVGLTNVNFQVVGYNVLSTRTANYEIDCYYNHQYLTSALNGNVKLINPSLVVYSEGGLFQGASYSTATVLNSAGGTTPAIPIAQGYVYGNKTVTTPLETIFLLQNYNSGLVNGLQTVYEGYGVGNQLPGVYTNFIIYGINYIYDGEYIWSVDIYNNVVQNKTRRAEAYGLQFVSQSPMVAYFLSTFDNSLFVFQGNYQLQKIMRFNEFDQIITGAFSDRDNTLVMYNDDKLIFLRTEPTAANTVIPIISSQPLESSQQNLVLTNTTKGLILTGNDGNNWYSWQYSYEPLGTVMPIDWQSGYFGAKGGVRSIVQAILVTVHSPSRALTTLNCFTYTTDAGLGAAYDEQKVSLVPFVINPADWSLNGMKTCRIQTQNMKALSTSVEIICNSKVDILNVELDVAPAELGKPSDRFSK